MSRGTQSQRKSRNLIEGLEPRVLLSSSAASAIAAASLSSVPGVVQPAAGVAPHAVSPTTETTLTQFASAEPTGDKTQSKAWVQNGFWWTVMPSSTGTWVYRLDGTTWTQVLKLSTDTAIRADVRCQGNTTWILMYSHATHVASLAAVDVVAGATPTQKISVSHPTVTVVPLANDVNTVTMDIDLTGRMWIAYDGTNFINVRYSDNNGATWSSQVQLGGNITSGDIAAISRVGDYGIGVMWSNQNDHRFHFRFHSYLQAATVWGNDEYPGAAGALNIGSGFADNDFHLVDDVNGNLYAAVKTGYDDNTNTAVGLLVRRANGSWDNMYSVDTRGSRPVVAVDQQRDTLIVAYTDNDLVSAQIVYKKTALSNISFGSQTTLIAGAHNNVTSTKQRQQGGTIAFLANDTTDVAIDSALINLSATPTSPTPPAAPGTAAAIPQLNVTALNNAAATAAENQTQARSWFRASHWWTVLADGTGTWVYRLDGTTWTKALQISASTTAAADTRAVADVTHILLTDGTSTAQLVSVELLDGATPTYQLWSARPTPTTITLTSHTRSATMDIDSGGVMWIAYDGNSNLFVQALSPNDNYANPQAPMIMASGVTDDDIITISRVGDNKIGVMWSDQNADRFGFRIHNGSDVPSVWGSDEGPGQHANLAIGSGIAGSQISMATLADGRLYALVKTGFNDGAGGQPELGLLVREANGQWDPELFSVDDVGDHGQVVVDPTHNKIVVAYTNASSSQSNNIVYKVSSLSAINFQGKNTIIPGGWDLVSTTKQKVNGAFPLLGTNATPDTAAGVLLTIA